MGGKAIYLMKRAGVGGRLVLGTEFYWTFKCKEAMQ